MCCRADDGDVAPSTARAATAAATACEHGRERRMMRTNDFRIGKRRLGRLARGQHSIDQIERSLRIPAS